MSVLLHCVQNLIPIKAVTTAREQKQKHKQKQAESKTEQTNGQEALQQKQWTNQQNN